MTPTERRSLLDTGASHSASESPSTNAAKPAAPSSIRSASDSARRLMKPPVLWVPVLSCGKPVPHPTDQADKKQSEVVEGSVDPRISVSFLRHDSCSSPFTNATVS